MKKKVILICFILTFVLLALGFLIFKDNHNKLIDSKDYSKNNAKILTELQDEDFWNKKIIKIINKEYHYRGIKKSDVKILGYGLLCKQYEEELKNCDYTVGFTKDNSFYSNGSYGNIGYHIVATEIAMADIGNGGVFYDVSSWYESDKEVILKYLGEDFEENYEGDFGFIEVIKLLTNKDDGSSMYNLYIISNETGEFLYKKSEKVISRETAKDLIANDIGISKNNIKFLYFRPENLIYECHFSYNGHTYEYEINAKDGTIIKGVDEIDIGNDEARKIAMDDAGITWNDLSHWDGDMGWVDEPHIEKIGTGNFALYKVTITTNKDKYYLYNISATDGKILSSKFGEKFVINNMNGNFKDFSFELESLFPKKQKLNVKIHELKMDNIYEFKDLIYLWIEFEGDKIVDWSIIDKDSDKNLGKMTKKELDELYNFEYYHKIIEVTSTITGVINVSNLKENIIYKYYKKYWGDCDSWSICSPKVVNDLGENIILYENFDKSWDKNTKPKIYKISPIVYNIYPSNDYQNYYENSTIDWNTYYIMYKKADESDLLKIMDSKNITFLSKYEIGEIKRGYDENYLYNDTDRDITLLIQDRNFDDMEIIIRSGKFIFCSHYVDNVTILN